MCGEDFGEIYPNEAIDTAMEFYSGGCENVVKHIYIYIYMCIYLSYIYKVKKGEQERYRAMWPS